MIRSEGHAQWWAGHWSLGLILTVLLACAPTVTVVAQTTDSAVPTAGPRVIHWYDAALALGGVGLLMTIDEPTQRFVQQHRSETKDDIAKVFRQVGEPWFAAGVSGGLLAVGLVADNAGLRRAGGRVAASAIISTLVGGVIKYTTSRSRPAEGVGAFEFNPFTSRKDSAGNELRRGFPSGHANVAFTLATSLADDIDSPVADVLLYTIATGTAWSRINDNRHWLSDTALGAVLGITTAKVVNGHWRIFDVKPPQFLVSTRGGAAVYWSFVF